MINNINKNNSKKECRAVFRQGPGNVKCMTVEKPKLQEGKVIVKVLHVGICGSDIDRVKDTNEKWDKVILGHEAVGEIEEISKSTSATYLLKKGDRVAIIPLIPCLKCYFCVKGLYSSCQNYSFVGSRINGALSDYIIIDPVNLLKLPDDDNIEKYVFLEPLTVALHAIYKTDLRFRKSATIFGAGTIGLLIFQILNNRNCYKVVTADIDTFKLAIARKIGSFHNINLIHESIEDYIRNNIDINGSDDVYEVSGANEAKKDAIKVAKPGGTVVLIGSSNKDVNFNGRTFELITRKELNIVGSWMSYSNPFPGNEWFSGIEMLNKDFIDTKSLISHRYKIKDINDAFNMISKNTEGYCKVIIDL